MTVAILVLLPLYIAALGLDVLFMDARVQQGSDGWNIDVSGPFASVALLGFVALAILTPIWVGRVHRNAQAFASQLLPSSSAWSAGAWFIPLVGGALAAKPMARILQDSGVPSPRIALAWGYSWSAYQACAVVVVGVMFALMLKLFFALGSNPSAAELQRAATALESQILPLQAIHLAFVTVAAGLMAWTVFALHAAQARAALARRRAVGGAMEGPWHASPGKPRAGP